MEHQTDWAPGEMGEAPFERLPNLSIPREHDQQLRQGHTHLTITTIFFPPQQPQADLGRLHRLPEHRQIVNYKHTSKEEGVHSCAYTGRDESMAVHHSHEADISHRLSWYCATLDDGLA